MPWARTTRSPSSVAAEPASPAAVARRRNPRRLNGHARLPGRTSRPGSSPDAEAIAGAAGPGVAGGGVTMRWGRRGGSRSVLLTVGQ
ncbi:MAG: hypothetical protein AAGH88_16755 [Planctomycetota bacterium]